MRIENSTHRLDQFDRIERVRGVLHRGDLKFLVP